MVLNKRYKYDGNPSIYLNKIQKDGLKNFSKKNYSFTRKDNCPICGCEKTEKISEKDRYGLRNNTLICRNCGLVFINPYFNEESLSRFYSDDYSTIYRGYNKENKDLIEQDFNKKITRGKEIYLFIKEQIGEIKHKKVVEIGCASGWILYYFLNKGNEVLGVDLNANCAELSKKQCINIYPGDTKELIKRKVKADIVICNHTLEHIPDIDNELSNIKAILKDDGVLFIGVPSIKNLRPYDNDFLKQIQNAHIYYFSLSTLNNAMEKNGFELIHGNEKIQALYKKRSPGYKANLTNGYHNIMTFLTNKENERKKINNIFKRVLADPLYKNYKKYLRQKAKLFSRSKV